MPKDIKIRTGDGVQTLSDVDKIETITADGDECLWIPEDSLRLRELRTAHPGIYNPMVGAYSKVTVDELIGEDNPEYGVLEVTQNGIYEASQDPRGPFKGYTKVIVNVTPPEYPASIKVIRLPNKTAYNYGDSMDYSGIKVSARQGNSLPWVSYEYPDGDIPFDELSFELIRNTRPYKFLINQNGRAVGGNWKTVAGIKIDARRAPVRCLVLHYFYSQDGLYHSVARYVSEKSFSYIYYDAQEGKYSDPVTSRFTYSSRGMVYHCDVEIPTSISNYSWNLPVNEIGTISDSNALGSKMYNLSCDVLQNSPLDKVTVSWNGLEGHNYTTYFDVIFN